MCLYPTVLRDSNFAGRNGLLVSCNKCPECRKKRAALWAFRIKEEERQHRSSYFLTLTYSSPPRTDCGFPTLVKRDLQLFFKKIRKRGEKIKYYACGEYGGLTKRPHYHMIIMGASEPAIDHSWQHGHLKYGKVSAASIRYVTNYLCKSGGLYPFDDPDGQPEFSLMSKGMGKSYMSPQKIQWHIDKNANYISICGKKQALPRYYKDVIFDEEQRRQFALDFLAEYNQKHAKLIAEIGLEAYHHNYSAATEQKQIQSDWVETTRNKI